MHKVLFDNLYTVILGNLQKNLNTFPQSCKLHNTGCQSNFKNFMLLLKIFCKCNCWVGRSWEIPFSDYQGLQNKFLKSLLFNEPNYNIVKLIHYTQSVWTYCVGYPLVKLLWQTICNFLLACCKISGILIYSQRFPDRSQTRRLGICLVCLVFFSARLVMCVESIILGINHFSWLVWYGSVCD